MESQKWLANVTIEDMPTEDLKFIAEVAGLKQAILLILLLPGLCISIPKNAFSKLKEKYIVQHYDGTRASVYKLSLECNLSQRYVYKLLKKSREKLNS